MLVITCGQNRLVDAGFVHLGNDLLCRPSGLVAFRELREEVRDVHVSVTGFLGTGLIQPSNNL
jgi:hypothetical protein